MDWRLILLCLLAAGGVAALRLGWNSPRRWAVALGWAALAIAAVGLALADGAWGVAVGSVVAMLAALGFLARAAVVSPRGNGRVQRDDAAVALPREPRAIGRRLGVFLLVVPLGLAASTLLATGAGLALDRAGWHAADSTALALCALPVVWTALASVQMTRPTRAGMIAPLLACAGAGALLWGTA